MTNWKRLGKAAAGVLLSAALLAGCGAEDGGMSGNGGGALSKSKVAELMQGAHEVDLRGLKAKEAKYSLDNAELMFAVQGCYFDGSFYGAAYKDKEKKKDLQLVKFSAKDGKLTVADPDLMKETPFRSLMGSSEQGIFVSRDELAHERDSNHNYLYNANGEVKDLGEVGYAYRPAPDGKQGLAIDAWLVKPNEDGTLPKVDFRKEKQLYKMGSFDEANLDAKGIGVFGTFDDTARDAIPVLYEYGFDGKLIREYEKYDANSKAADGVVMLDKYIVAVGYDILIYDRQTGKLAGRIDEEYVHFGVTAFRMDGNHFAVLYPKNISNRLEIHAFELP